MKNEYGYENNKSNSVPKGRYLGDAFLFGGKMNYPDDFKELDDLIEKAVNENNVEISVKDKMCSFSKEIFIRSKKWNHIVEKINITDIGIDAKYGYSIPLIVTTKILTAIDRVREREKEYNFLVYFKD